MEIVNIVATIKTSPSYNLQDIRNVIPDTYYPSYKAVWLNMRLQPEGYYVAFYKSGKFLVTGVKSVDTINDISTRVIKILKQTKIKIENIKITIHNIVYTDNLNTNVNLENLVHNLDSNKASYEPEQFPSLIYKDSGATLLVFSNGKVIITGSTEENEAIRVFENFKKIIHIS